MKSQCLNTEFFDEIHFQPATPAASEGVPGPRATQQLWRSYSEWRQRWGPPCPACAWRSEQDPVAKVVVGEWLVNGCWF